MRSLIPTVAALLVILPFVDFSAAATPGNSVTKPAPAAPAAPASPDNDAAAKHARRTVCLKEAKTKKLLGEQKAAFLRDCIASH